MSTNISNTPGAAPFYPASSSGYSSADLPDLKNLGPEQIQQLVANGPLTGEQLQQLVASGALSPAQLEQLIPADDPREAQLRQLFAEIAGTEGVGGPSDDFGATAISLPKLAVVAEMQGLSTADLLQLMRAESRKTTELLLQTTMQSIKNLQSQIAENHKDTISNLETAAKAIEKAQKLMAVMNVVKWAAIGVGAVVAVASIVLSGGAAAPLAIALFSAGLMVATTCLSEIKGPDGKSPMDDLMEGLGKAMQKVAEAADKVPPFVKAYIAAIATIGTVMAACVAPSSLALTLPLLALAVVAALPDKTLSDEMKGQVMACIVMVGATILLSTACVGAVGSMVSSQTSVAATTATKEASKAVVDAGEAAAKMAVQSAADAASDAGSVVDDVANAGAQAGQNSVPPSAWARLADSSIGDKAKMIRKAAEVLEAGLKITQGGTEIAVAIDEYDAAKANALVMALKEEMKMLQILLGDDASFTQMLADIQAQLDSGCSEIVAIEHQTQQNINEMMYS